MIDDTSTALAARAEEFSLAIFAAAGRGLFTPSDLKRYRISHDVAVRLHLISIYLRSIPPYWIEPEVEELCRKILRKLQAIVELHGQRNRRTSLSDIFLPLRRSDATYLETCVVTFFGIPAEAEEFKRTCDDLYQRLSGDQRDEELPESALRDIDGPGASADIDGIVEALQRVVECDQTLHEDTSTVPVCVEEGSSVALLHPARLCLHDIPGYDAARLTFLVSSVDMSLWQEFSLIT